MLRYRSDGEQVTIGVGYLLGRDVARAEWVARFDALLQQPAWGPRLQSELIATLRAATLALLDADSPLHLAGELASKAAANYFRFHCGAGRASSNLFVEPAAVRQ